MAELEELLRTAGVAVVGTLVQHREKPHPNSYLGTGKLEELKDLVKELDANVVACDDDAVRVGAVLRPADKPDDLSMMGFLDLAIEALGIDKLDHNLDLRVPSASL